MSNLMQNLKKYVLEKLVDIAEIGVFIAVLFILLLKTTISVNIVLGIALVLLVVFFLVTRYTKKKFDAWKTPVMSKVEEAKYLVFDTAYTLVACAILLFITYGFVNNPTLLLVFVSLVFLLIEQKKWRDYIRKHKEPEKVIEAEFSEETAPEFIEDVKIEDSEDIREGQDEKCNPPESQGLTEDKKKEVD
jgi:hypothetical protein